MTGLIALPAKIAESALFSGAQSLFSKIPPKVWLAIGCAVAAFLGVLWHRHEVKVTIANAKAQAQHQQLAADQAVVDKMVAGWRAAAAKAKADDAANVARVQAKQAAISSDTEKSYEDRIAAARAESQRLRDQQAARQRSAGSGGTAPVSSISTAASGSAQGAGEDGLSNDDKLIATEQAIQLDELIKWAERQHSVPVNGK